ncbi:MAG: DUF3501 family protein [Gammaproteobacteria bacterium]
MEKLSRDDLYTLEAYAEKRKEFRTRVMEHKKNRRLAIGPNATLYFEDRLTIQYQIQEMLRIEKVFEAEGIEDELQAYNPLVPDGSNWKATFMLEFEDADERRRQLSKLVGIESCVWMKVDGNKLITPIYNEDLERSTEDKTSSVHFMRFELTPEDVKALKEENADISAGISHELYNYTVSPVPAEIRNSLVEDLD